MIKEVLFIGSGEQEMALATSLGPSVDIRYGCPDLESKGLEPFHGMGGYQKIYDLFKSVRNNGCDAIIIGQGYEDALSLTPNPLKGLKVPVIHFNPDYPDALVYTTAKPPYFDEDSSRVDTFIGGYIEPSTFYLAIKRAGGIRADKLIQKRFG
ncbi:MAG: hypothetical protein JW727_00335 [Candidatus Aenigmarchaeota archaeon]|nr:hypothetical protein [Candidatus Aenigmarchaeota archaeon]